jgi:Kef-type K+ transport system membrane component KefB
VRTVAWFSILLVMGLLGSQWLPSLGSASLLVARGLLTLTMIALAFIMIHVGYEFELDKARLGQYAWDYVVAFGAASLPWLFVSLYFVVVMLPANASSSWQAWKEGLLVGRFASPTSAGVLFAMLAAAGLSATWMFRKARILAIFDDLDTVLLLVPLQAMIIGWAPTLAVSGILSLALLAAAYAWLHRLGLPSTWPWVLGYASVITIACKLVETLSRRVDQGAPVHIEVLLPAFVLGCVMRRPSGQDPHRDDVREGHQEGPEGVSEQRISTIISSIFMLLVGLSMPPVFHGSGRVAAASGSAAQTLTAGQASMTWETTIIHALVITSLANLGKMVPAISYRREASWRERLALAISMWPRGEVGAGILVISVSYGIGGPVLTVAMLSLALNLALTGLFILIVKRLMLGAPIVPERARVLSRG